MAVPSILDIVVALPEVETDITAPTEATATITTASTDDSEDIEIPTAAAGNGLQTLPATLSEGQTTTPPTSGAALPSEASEGQTTPPTSGAALLSEVSEGQTISPIPGPVQHATKWKSQVFQPGPKRTARYVFILYMFALY